MYTYLHIALCIQDCCDWWPKLQMCGVFDTFYSNSGVILYQIWSGKLVWIVSDIYNLDNILQAAKQTAVEAALYVLYLGINCVNVYAIY